MARIDIIPFRLRAWKDDDLKSAFEQLPENVDRSEVIRAALRAYFSLEGVNTLPVPKKCDRSEIKRIPQLKMEGVELTKVEKSADEINDALDDLLGDF